MSAQSIIVFFLILPMALSCQKQTQDLADSASLQHELERMYQTDQSLRKGADSLVALYGQDSEEVRRLWDQQKAIDRENLTRLQEIVSEHGWPGLSEVGERASTAAFLVLQHADLVVQKEYLPLVRAAWAEGEISGQHLALLEDRVLVGEGHAQLYGTQLFRDEHTGELKLYPISDEVNVDQRRSEKGMWSLAEYLLLYGIEYKGPDE